MKRAIVGIVLLSAPLAADDVYLRGGGQITGEIVEQTADAVTVDVGGGTLSVPMSSVERIAAGTSPLEDYRTRAAAVTAGDVEAWRQLGRWAAARGLAMQAREAYAEVVAVQPDDAEANRALGRVELDGRWVTEEESYRARGYVLFEGEWMTPAERKEIIVYRHDREQAQREELAAQIEADEAAAREEEAQEAAESEEFWNDAVPELGDPVFWGWGAGPTVWPAQPMQQPYAERGW